MVSFPLWQRDKLLAPFVLKYFMKKNTTWKLKEKKHPQLLVTTTSWFLLFELPFTSIILHWFVLFHCFFGGTLSSLKINFNAHAINVRQQRQKKGTKWLHTNVLNTCSVTPIIIIISSLFPVSLFIRFKHVPLDVKPIPNSSLRECSCSFFDVRLVLWYNNQNSEFGNNNNEG